MLLRLAFNLRQDAMKKRFTGFVWNLTCQGNGEGFPLQSVYHGWPSCAETQVYALPWTPSILANSDGKGTCFHWSFRPWPFEIVILSSLLKLLAGGLCPWSSATRACWVGLSCYVLEGTSWVEWVFTASPLVFPVMLVSFRVDLDEANCTDRWCWWGCCSWLCPGRVGCRWLGQFKRNGERNP